MRCVKRRCLAGSAVVLSLCLTGVASAALIGNPQIDGGFKLMGLSAEPGVKASTEDVANTFFFDIYYKEFQIDGAQASTFGGGFAAGDKVIAIAAVGVEPMTFRGSFLKIDFGAKGSFAANGSTSFMTHSTFGDFQLQSNTNNGYQTVNTGGGQGFESVRYNDGLTGTFLRQGGVGTEEGLPFAFLAAFQGDPNDHQFKDHVAYTWYISREGLVRWAEAGGSDYLLPQFDFVLQSGETAAYFSIPEPGVLSLVMLGLGAFAARRPRFA